jgi:Ran GTPase-activating protein (RanGAP) involved in mRNA processing and transport
MATKHALQNILEDMDVRVRSYSGRGMYGKSCLGVTIDQDLGPFLSDLMQEMGNLDPDNGEELDAYTDICDAFRSMRTDNMGMGTIVYFQRVEFVSEESDDEDDEEEGEEASP